MSGPSLQQKLDHLIENLAEAEREYAAGIPYPENKTTAPGPKRSPSSKITSPPSAR